MLQRFFMYAFTPDQTEAFMHLTQQVRTLPTPIGVNIDFTPW